MSNYEEIKQALAEGNWQQAMLIAFSNSLQLKLTSTVRVPNFEAKRIETIFNLIQGLETQIESEILASNYQHLLDFHQQQLNSADEIWQKNRETLVKIFQLLAGNLGNLPEEKNNLSRENSEKYVAEISFPLGEKTADNLEQFDLQLVTQAREGEDEEQISDGEESDSMFEAEISENWIDELNENEKVQINESFEDENLGGASQLEDLPIVEEDITDGEEKEEIVEEEIVMEEQPAENWDDLDWGEDQETEENQEIGDIRENPISQESSPSLEVNDDWQEWLDGDELSQEKENYDLEKIDWNQEEWQENKS